MDQPPEMSRKRRRAFIFLAIIISASGISWWYLSLRREPSPHDAAISVNLPPPSSPLPTATPAFPASSKASPPSSDLVSVLPDPETRLSDLRTSLQNLEISARQKIADINDTEGSGVVIAVPRISISQRLELSRSLEQFAESLPPDKQTEFLASAFQIMDAYTQRKGEFLVLSLYAQNNSKSNILWIYEVDAVEALEVGQHGMLNIKDSSQLRAAKSIPFSSNVGAGRNTARYAHLLQLQAE